MSHTFSIFENQSEVLHTSKISANCSKGNTAQWNSSKENFASSMIRFRVLQTTSCPSRTVWTEFINLTDRFSTDIVTKGYWLSQSLYFSILDNIAGFFVKSEPFYAQHLKPFSTIFYKSSMFSRKINDICLLLFSIIFLQLYSPSDTEMKDNRACYRIPNTALPIISFTNLHYANLAHYKNPDKNPPDYFFLILCRLLSPPVRTGAGN